MPELQGLCLCRLGAYLLVYTNIDLVVLAWSVKSEEVRHLVYTNIDLVVMAWSVKSDEVRLLVYTNIDLVVLAWSVKSDEVRLLVYTLTMPELQGLCSRRLGVYNLFTFY
jgi:hypothetical protein